LEKRGLVFGAFGEFSNSCYSLFTAIAMAGAARVVSFGVISPKHALSKQKNLLFWGLAAQRGWACLILERFHEFLLSPRRSHGRHARARHGFSWAPHLLL
jgi:hypothetical protein